MKKTLFILLFIVTYSISGQSFFESGKVFYRDGTTEKGYLKMKYSTIKFKKKNTARKSITLTYKEVKKITINQEGKNIEYIYKIIKGKKKGKFKLLESVIYGKASLYKLTHETSLGNSGIGPVSIGLSYNGANFYIGKEASSFVEFIGENSIALGRKSIKKGLLKYFNDCEPFIEKIKNKEFKNKDIVQAVAFYNKNCASK